MLPSSRPQVAEPFARMERTGSGIAILTRSLPHAFSRSSGDFCEVAQVEAEDSVFYLGCSEAGGAVDSDVVLAGQRDRADIAVAAIAFWLDGMRIQCSLRCGPQADRVDIWIKEKNNGFGML